MEMKKLIHKTREIEQKPYLMEHREVLQEAEVLEEDVGDLVEKGWDALKKGKEKLSQKVRQALAKVVGYFKKQLKRAIALVKKGAAKGLGLALTIIESAQKFMNRHPLLAKAVAISAFSVVVFALMSVFDPSQAEAALQGGGEVLDSETLRQMKGFLKAASIDKIESVNIDQASEMLQAIDRIEQLQDTEKVEKIAELQGKAAEEVKASFQKIQELQNKSSGATSKLLDAFKTVSNEVYVEIKEMSNAFGGSAEQEVGATEKGSKALDKLGLNA